MNGNKLPTLSIQLPSGEHRIHILTQPLTTIGRLVSNDIVLQDWHVSRVHASIKLDRAFVLVEDLGSKNGILLNGRPVTHEALTEGDTLVIGQCTLRFLWEAGNPLHIDAEPLSSIPGWRFTTGDDSRETEK